MSKLSPRVLDLVAAHSGRPEPGLDLSSPRDRDAIESLYRQTMRHWFELTGQGAAAEPVEVTRVYQELLRLIGEVGEPRATRLRRQWAREWWDETGVCPFCGERGQYHDPEPGGKTTDA